MSGDCQVGHSLQSMTKNNIMVKRSFVKILDSMHKFVIIGKSMGFHWQVRDVLKRVWNGVAASMQKNSTQVYGRLSLSLSLSLKGTKQENVII